MNGIGCELEFVGGNSYKFYRALLVGASTRPGATPTVITHYGRIGANGSVTVHHLTLQAAVAKYVSLLAAKTRKGYVETVPTIAFAVPDDDVADAASTSTVTGTGGVSTAAAWRVVRAWTEFMRAAQRTDGGDIRALLTDDDLPIEVRRLLVHDDRVDAELLLDLTRDPDVPQVQSEAFLRLLNNNPSRD